MIPAMGDPGHWLFILAGGILGVAIIASLARLLVGPSLPDRVVALDLIGFLSIGLLSVFSIVTQRYELLGVALVAALILFLGTAAFALYLERRAEP
jgi:multicomponent Na+:H+ antiporter subunit F